MDNGRRWLFTDRQRFVAVIAAVVTIFLLCMGVGGAGGWAFGLALLVLFGTGAALVLVGLRHSGNAWIRGQAHVIRASRRPGHKIVGRCDMELLVDVAGQETIRAKFRDSSAPTSKWPRPGMILPIEVAPKNHRQLRIRWEKVPAHHEQPATQSAADGIEYSPTPAVPQVVSTEIHGEDTPAAVATIAPPSVDDLPPIEFHEPSPADGGYQVDPDEYADLENLPSIEDLPDPGVRADDDDPDRRPIALVAPGQRPAEPDPITLVPPVAYTRDAEVTEVRDPAAEPGDPDPEPVTVLDVDRDPEPATDVQPVAVTTVESTPDVDDAAVTTVEPETVLDVDHVLDDEPDRSPDLVGEVDDDSAWRPPAAALLVAPATIGDTDPDLDQTAETPAPTEALTTTDALDPAETPAATEAEADADPAGLPVITLVEPVTTAEPLPVRRPGATLPPSVRDEPVIPDISMDGGIAAFLSAYPIPQQREPDLDNPTGVGLMLIVSDLDRSLGFYRDKLGFDEIDNGPGSAVLGFGGGRVLLRRVVDMSPVDRRVVHLHLDVPNVDETYAELRRKGVDFVHRPRVMSRGDRYELWAATFRDPDGHAIALAQWRERDPD